MGTDPDRETPAARCGWSGTAATFLATAPDAWADAMATRHRARWGRGATATQRAAWLDCAGALRPALEGAILARPDAAGWGLAFEYELPWEGGRRPDLVVLAGDDLLVLEFKMAATASSAAIDQAAGYARDLALYHEGSRGRRVVAVVVPTRGRGAGTRRDDVLIRPPTALAGLLDEIGPGAVPAADLDAWVGADYAPLPGVVDAARRIFRREPLPEIRRAEAAGIPALLDRLARLAAEAEAAGGRHVVLITGVPGSGKTLVGLEFVHRLGESDGRRRAVFLSGNGPLVEVLQHALRSKVFVRPVRNFYVEHQVRAEKAPAEHVVVFDEAQRAWDAGRMAEKYGIGAGAPGAIATIAARSPAWSVVVGLIGPGQEIHVGEEGGPALWADAVDAGGLPWVVHAPPRLAGVFAGLPPGRVELDESLDLTLSLRAHRAEDVQRWVDHLLSGDLDAARSLAPTLAASGFHARLTRDLDAAKAYCRARYADAPSKTYGLIASSRARDLPKFGVPNDFPSTRRVRLGPWFVDPADSPASCRALDAVATEFGCQGLELDLPIACWGDDLAWSDAQSPPRWVSRATRQAGVADPHRLRLNAYRVLLTRGRDGVVAFVPPSTAMDATFAALDRAGFAALDAGA